VKAEESRAVELRPNSCLQRQACSRSGETEQLCRHGAAQPSSRQPAGRKGVWKHRRAFRRASEPCLQPAG